MAATSQPPLTMTLRHHGTTVRTHVGQGSILYVFFGSIRQARRCARCYPLVHGPEVADMPREAMALVWLDETPHLFSGSLTDALRRGKGYLRARQLGEHTRQNAEKQALRQFNAQYANGIGEGS